MRGADSEPDRPAVIGRRPQRGDTGYMWTAEDRFGQRVGARGGAMEGYIKVQRPGELHSDETLARYAPGEQKVT